MWPFNFWWKQISTILFNHVDLENGEDEDMLEERGDADLHPTVWKVKGKRNSFGNHSPNSNGGSV